MLPVTRRSRIKQIVMEKKSVVVSDLSMTFNVTEETIRRDLKILEEEGLLQRTYGGAYILDGVQNEVNVELREKVFVSNKKNIAKKAKKLVNNGDSIFLDNSTTAFYVADELKDMRVTVITNSYKILSTLCNISGINLIVTGGAYYPQSRAFLGSMCAKAISNYNVDIAFVSCRTLSMDKGITDASEELAFLRRTIISHAAKSYIIADYSKFNKPSFINTCGFEEISGIITDSKLPKEWGTFLAQKGLEIYD